MSLKKYNNQKGSKEISSIKKDTIRLLKFIYGKILLYFVLFTYVNISAILTNLQISDFFSVKQNFLPE